MGKEIGYCELCGERILEEEFTEGGAIQVQNKSYCANCRAEAPAPAPVPSPALQARRPAAARPRPSPATRQPATPPPTPQPSKAPLLIGGGVGLVALIVMLVLFLGGTGDETDKKKTTPGTASSGLDREKQAGQMLMEIRSFWEGHPDQADAAITRIDEALKSAAGTQVEAPLRDLKTEIEGKREAARAAETVRANLKRAGALIATDAAAGEHQYERYAEITALLAETETLTRTQGLTDEGVKVTEVRTDYVKGYETVAGSDEHYGGCYNAAVSLAGVGRYEDAIKLIDAYPQKFRSSKSWKRLEDLKRDFERKK